MPQSLTDYKSALVHVMAWCCQATSHYMNQCWPRSAQPYDISRLQWVNSLGPGNALWQHRSRSTLAQVRACCLMAPNHYYPNQCWFRINKLLWYLLEKKITPAAQATIEYNEFENDTFKIIVPSPRCQWVKSVQMMVMMSNCHTIFLRIKPSFGGHFVNASSQWETMLHCNIVSHWLGTCTKWFLSLYGLALSHPQPWCIEIQGWI